MTTTAQNIPQIVLGSTSPFRKQLLDKLRLPFIQDSPEIDESPLKNETPKEMVARLALEKAKMFTQKYPQHIIITSDQCAVFNNRCVQGQSNSTVLPSFRFDSARFNSAVSTFGSISLV